MKLTSPAFTESQTIPQKFTCDGTDVSPELNWSGAPANTQSFVLIMDDPDAPPGTWIHWTIFNIPATQTRLAEGTPKQEKLDNGALQGAIWGVNEFSRVGYFGPCPPPGPAHRYYFKLYALDSTLSLDSKATKFDIEKAIKGHILAKSQLMGQYGR